MKRSKFSLSYTRLFSCDMGSLIPFGITEVLPGDSMQHSAAALVRASPLLTPVMHPVSVTMHHWYVPHRLVWEDFEDFITGGADGNNAAVFPTITAPGGGVGFAVGTLGDYLGSPTAVASLEVSALPFRAYAKIWNEFYRDQDLQTELVIDETSGPDTTTSVTLQNGGWEKDYFTSARPWEQKGTAVTIGLAGTAPVTGIGWKGTVSDAPGETIRQTTTPAVFAHAVNAIVDPLYVKADTGTGASMKPQVFADLSGAGAISMNDLREAMGIQRYQEARARYGSRYTEYLRYLGVRSSDARLQRPEYLGGGRDTIQFSEVLQTGVTTSGSSLGVGSLRGHGLTAMRSNRYRRFFEEHGYIISLMCIRPKTMYLDGLPRHWNRRTKEDFWQFELQHLGQQAVLNKEVYAAHATPGGTFGYQDRYDEYRRNESSIAGEFRTTLNMWHFARSFGSTPALNADFVKCVPTENPFAVNSANTMWIMAKHSMQARRLVSAVGNSYIY